MKLFDLTGRQALVIGGVGPYGRQATVGLCQAGARVTIATRNRKILDRDPKTFHPTNPPAVDLCNLTNDDDVRALADRQGAAGIVVYSAAPGSGYGWKQTPASFERAILAHGLLAWAVLHHFGDAMAAYGRGSITTLGSVQAHGGPDFTLYPSGWEPPADYTFGKAGLLNLTRHAAAVYGPRGVRCNHITLGPFQKDPASDDADRVTKRIYLDRMAGPNDLLGPIVFLASDASAFVTGADLVVDGGQTAAY